MSYSIKQNDKNFNIFEKNSEILIELDFEEKKAKEICRKLNLGSGFNGWTPPFFAIKYNAKLS